MNDQLEPRALAAGLMTHVPWAAEGVVLDALQSFSRVAVAALGIDYGRPDPFTRELPCIKTALQGLTNDGILYQHHVTCGLSVSYYSYHVANVEDLAAVLAGSSAWPEAEDVVRKVATGANAIVAGVAVEILEHAARLKNCPAGIFAKARSYLDGLGLQDRGSRSVVAFG